MSMRRPTSRILMTAVLTILVLIVIASLPLLFASMGSDLSGRSESVRYNIATGEPVADPFARPDGSDPARITILIESMSENTRQIRLVVMGRRFCTDSCDPMTINLYALPAENDPLSLPSTVSIDLPTNSQPFDTEEYLPVVGRPQSFPVDKYVLRLGVAVVSTSKDGVVMPLTREQLDERGVIIMTEEIMPRFVVKERIPNDELSVRDDLISLGISMQVTLSFQHPAYLRIEAFLLVLLIGITGIVTVLRQDMDDLLFGIGSLILSMWGIRAILVQTDYDGVTIVDVVLVLFAILILLGCLIRLTLHVHAQDRRDPDAEPADPS